MHACQGLSALETEIAHDLEITAHPHMEWMVPRLHAGKPALDVLIVGAGQSGLVTAFGLMRERVRNVLVIDRAPEGKEGPWVTFARMPTLRSPKVQTGPDLGMPSLTFQAWYEAQHGAQAFADMNLIPSVDWHEYLLWYRRILDLPVRNDVAATAIAPGRLDDGGPCLLVTLSTGEVLATRKLVLATGQDGTGVWWMPDFVRNLPMAAEMGRRAIQIYPKSVLIRTNYATYSMYSGDFATAIDQAQIALNLVDGIRRAGKRGGQAGAAELLRLTSA